MQEDLKCSFCKKGRDDVEKLVAGPQVYICNECVTKSYEIITDDDSEPETILKAVYPSPQQIKKHIDNYVVGQYDAKIALSVAISNHFKRLLNPTMNGVEIGKSNILIIGPTGVGKTLMIQVIADLLNVPFVIGDATSLTEAGFIGGNVEEILGMLIHKAGGDIEKAQKGIVYIDEIDKKGHKRSGFDKDPSGEGVQQALLKIVEGTTCLVPTQGAKYSPMADIVEFDTTNVLFIAGGSFTGLDDVIKKRRSGKSLIGFESDIPNSDKLNVKPLPSDLIDYGMIPEFVGRFPITVEFHNLTLDDLMLIITEPKNSILKQYKEMFAIDGFELEFTDEALNRIAKACAKLKMGARGLRQIFESVLVPIQFELPQYKEKGIKKVTVEESMIE